MLLIKITQDYARLCKVCVKFVQSLCEVCVKLKLWEELRPSEIKILSALPLSYGKMYISLLNLDRWVTSRIKTYGFIVKSITATNPPYDR